METHHIVPVGRLPDLILAVLDAPGPALLLEEVEDQVGLVAALGALRALEVLLGRLDLPGSVVHTSLDVDVVAGPRLHDLLVDVLGRAVDGAELQQLRPLEGAGREGRDAVELELLVRRQQGDSCLSDRVPLLISLVQLKQVVIQIFLFPLRCGLQPLGVSPVDGVLEVELLLPPRHRDLVLALLGARLREDAHTLVQAV